MEGEEIKNALFAVQALVRRTAKDSLPCVFLCRAPLLLLCRAGRVAVRLRVSLPCDVFSAVRFPPSLPSSFLCRAFSRRLHGNAVFAVREALGNDLRTAKGQNGARQRPLARQRAFFP